MNDETIERADRPECLDGFTRRIRVGCGSLYVTITMLDDGTPFEVFATLGKAGGCPAASVEAVARLVSDLFRCGVDINVPLKTLVGISCHRAMPGDPKSNPPLSCFDGIAQTLLLFRDEFQTRPVRQHEPHHFGVGSAPDGKKEGAQNGTDYSV